MAAPAAASSSTIDVCLCAPRPLQGPAVLGRGACADLPAHDVTRLDYTARDWSRWDSFDLERFTLAGIKRPQHGLGGGATDQLVCPQSACPDGHCLTPHDAAHCYFHLFRQSLIRSFYAEAHQRFRHLQTGVGGVDDQLNNLRKTKLLPVQEISNQLSYGLNQEYNSWRRNTKDRMRNEIRSAHAGAALDVTALDAQVDLLFDSTPFDPRSFVECSALCDWLSEIVRTHLSFQCLDRSIVLPRYTGSPHSDWRPFGVWPNTDGSLDAGQIMWRCPTVGFFYGHYLHLIKDDTLLRALRRAMYASLAAQWYWHTVSSQGLHHHLESQWLLRITAFLSHAFVLFRSEEELKLRGSWLAADAVTSTDRESGQWTNADLTAWCEELLGEVDTRMRVGGQTEFLASYYFYVLDLLSQLVLHPVSQKCLDMAQRIIDRVQWDMAAHLHPSSGTFAGPTARSYDLFAGCHNVQDRVDMHLYFKIVCEPHASAFKDVTIKTRSDGREIKANLMLRPFVQSVCKGQESLPVILPPSGNIDPDYHRIWLAKSQLAGFGRLPVGPLTRITLGMPYRVMEQRFSTVVGQERMNFITPLYQIGHAGEDTVSLPTAVFACARFGGAPVPNTPLAMVNHGQTNCTSFVRLFSRIGVDSDPFHRDSPLGVAGDAKQALSRQITTQYQGWMLVTSMLAGSACMPESELKGSWQSNLVLPLNCEGIFADDFALPRAVGTRVRLPPTAIFTVRHVGACIGVRLGPFTCDDHIPHSDKIEPISEVEAGIEVGRNAWSVTWVVDASSVLTGCGRVVVHHRHKNEAAPVPPKPFRCSWLWGSGHTATDAEHRSLASLLRQSQLDESFTATPDWSPDNQPLKTYPAPHPACSSHEMGSQTWSIDAYLPSGKLKLSVRRKDVYQPHGHAPAYKLPPQGPMHASPYYIKDIQRRVNDDPILDWSEGEDSYRVRSYAAEQLFEPHRSGACNQVVKQPVAEHAA